VNGFEYRIVDEDGEPTGGGHFNVPFDDLSVSDRWQPRRAPFRQQRRLVGEWEFIDDLAFVSSTQGEGDQQ
jgi:hypothetical protein